MAGKNNIQRMKELITLLNKANDEYFGDDAPTLSDREYDELFAELSELEKITGIVFSTSPTRRTGGSVKNGLEKVKHTKPMLSAKKTKDPEDVVAFAQISDTLLSWKLDGLTLVLRYNEGKFEKAITRGDNGIIGEDVTRTVAYLRNVPQTVECMQPFEVRGEGVMSWADFNAVTPGTDRGHPRNIAAGAVRALEPDVNTLHRIDFVAFELIQPGDNRKTKVQQLEFLIRQGFNVVQFEQTKATWDRKKLLSAINAFDPETYVYPVDGIIAEYNDVAFGKSLGATSHHENRMLALKWTDNLYETVFRGATLATTRTGMVSIIAEFDPVIIDGGTVQRADMHSLGNFEKFKFGIGDKIKVFKANMIIPQVAENLTQSGTYMLPDRCSCCGRRLEVRKSATGTRNLYCPNLECIARNSQKIARLCEKDGLNIEALTAARIEDLMAYDLIHSYADIFHLREKKERMLTISGFGEGTCVNIIRGVENARKTTLGRLLYGMGIERMGAGPARSIDEYFYGSWDRFAQAIGDGFDFHGIEGISKALNDSIYDWYKEAVKTAAFNDLLKELSFNDKNPKEEKEEKKEAVAEEKGNESKAPSSSTANFFTGKKVAFTGTVNGMSPGTMAGILELIGANVSKTVETDTYCLVVGKNPDAKILSQALLKKIRVFTEEEFAQMLAQ